MISVKNTVSILFLIVSGGVFGQVDFLMDYEGPALGTSVKTITLSDYYNKNYAQFKVARVEEGYNTIPQGTPKYTTKIVKDYDTAGYLIAQIQYDHQYHMKTVLGTFERPIRSTYNYSSDRHHIIEVLFVKLGGRIDTTYVNQLFFDNNDRLIRRSCKSHQTDYERDILYEYDGFGNCLKESWGFGKQFYSVSYQYEYDKNGNILSEGREGNLSYLRSFRYDSLMRVVEITSPNDTLELMYDQMSNITQIKFSKSVKVDEMDLNYFGLSCKSGIYSFVYDEESRLIERDFYCSDSSGAYVVGRSQPPLKLKYSYLENGLISEVKQVETTFTMVPKKRRAPPYFNFSYSYKFRNEE